MKTPTVLQRPLRDAEGPWASFSVPLPNHTQNLKQKKSLNDLEHYKVKYMPFVCY